MRITHDQLIKEVCIAFPRDVVTLFLRYLAKKVLVVDSLEELLAS